MGMMFALGKTVLQFSRVTTEKNTSSSDFQTCSEGHLPALHVAEAFWLLSLHSSPNPSLPISSQLTLSQLAAHWAD